jgi:hypothetical protein
MKAETKKQLTIAGAVTFMVFCSPWIHRLAYENLMNANPALDPKDAHIWAFMLSLVGIFVGYLAANGAL